jgi:hypothetical protein
MMADDLQLQAGFEALFLRAAEAMQRAVMDGPGARSDELVVRDTETLANSKQVTAPIIEGNTATVILSYGRTDDTNPKSGGPSADYAVQVHERTDVPHAVGQAKWLEIATLEAAPTFAADIERKRGR